MEPGEEQNPPFLSSTASSIIIDPKTNNFKTKQGRDIQTTRIQRNIDEVGIATDSVIQMTGVQLSREVSLVGQEEIGEKNSSTIMKNEVIKVDVFDSSSGPVRLPSVNSMEQNNQRMEAINQQQLKTQEAHHRQSEGIQIDHPKQVTQQFQSQQPILYKKNYLIGSKEQQKQHQHHMKKKHAIPTLSQPPQTVKIKQKRGRFSVLENCDGDDTSAQRPNIRLSGGTNSNHRQDTIGVDASSQKPLTSPIKQTRTNSIPTFQPILQKGAMEHSNGAATKAQQTVPYTTSNSYPVQYSTSVHSAVDPSLTSVSMEKKGRFMISNVDASLVKQVGTKTSNKVPLPHTVGGLVNQKRCDSVVNLNVQQQLVTGPLSTMCVEQATTARAINIQTSPKNALSDKVIGSGKGVGTKIASTTTSISHASKGVLSRGNMGKMFHFLEQMKLEVTDAEKLTKSLQSDNKFLREKNKELEARCNEVDKRYAEEKVAREAAESKMKSLKKRLKEIRGNASNVPINTEVNHSLNIEQKIIPNTNETESGKAKTATGVMCSQDIVNEMNSEGHSGIMSRPQDDKMDINSKTGVVSNASFQLLHCTTKREASIHPGSLNSQIDHQFRKGDHSVVPCSITVGSSHGAFDPLTQPIAMDDKIHNHSNLEGMRNTSLHKSSDSLATFDPLSTSAQQLGKQQSKTVEASHTETFDNSCLASQNTLNKLPVLHSPEVATSTITELLQNNHLCPKPIEKFDPYNNFSSI